MESKPLRIVTFNFLPIGYRILTDWIHNNGHHHVLAVTTPGPKSRPTPAYINVVDMAPREVDVLVTTRLRKVATPLIRALEPDLITCLSFPYRITPELCEIPTHGAVNVHPAVLPAYRGPNVMRQFYEDSPVFGATAHWIAPEYDTGNILSQKSAPIPDVVTLEAVTPKWRSLMVESLNEGLERAIAGDPGTPQDDAQASYAAPFTEEEHWLNWQEQRLIIQRKVVALNMLGAGQAKAKIDGKTFRVMIAEALLDQTSEAVPGSCLERNDDHMVVQTRDGPIRIQVQSLT